MRTRALTVTLFLLALGCDARPSERSTAPSAPSSVAATPTAPPITVVALRFMPFPSEPQTFHGPIELHADGTVTSPSDTIGKMIGARFVADNGGTIFSVAASGAVGGDAALTAMTFDGDVLVISDPPQTSRVTVSDDGSIALNGTPIPHNGHFEGGIPPGGKRAALLLVAVMMMHGRGFRHATPAASVR